MNGYIFFCFVWLHWLDTCSEPRKSESDVTKMTLIEVKCVLGLRVMSSGGLVLCECLRSLLGYFDWIFFWIFFAQFLKFENWNNNKMSWMSLTSRKSVSIFFVLYFLFCLGSDLDMLLCFVVASCSHLLTRAVRFSFSLFVLLLMYRLDLLTDWHKSFCLGAYMSSHLMVVKLSWSWVLGLLGIKSESLFG